MLLVVATLLSSSSALGDDVETIADTLFDQGIQALDAGNHAKACELFARSNAVEPSAGTLLNLADCHEINNRFASAWAACRQAANIASRLGPAQTLKVDAGNACAKKNLPYLSYVEVRLNGAPEGTRIQRQRKGSDGALEDVKPGLRLPTDAGTWAISVVLDGYETWTTTVAVCLPGEARCTGLRNPHVGADVLVQVPPLKKVAARSVPILGYVLGGVGLASVGTSLAFGGLARGAYADADALCPAHTNCSNAALDINDEAKAWATAANIAAGVGGVLTVAGAYLVLTHSPAQGDQPSAAPATRIGVMPGPGGLLVSLDNRF